MDAVFWPECARSGGMVAPFPLAKFEVKNNSNMHRIWNLTHNLMAS